MSATFVWRYFTYAINQGSICESERESLFGDRALQLLQKHTAML